MIPNVMLRSTVNVIFIVWSILLPPCSSCQEPAYQDILYGGAWKHVTINPSKEYTDVGLIEEHLTHYLQNSKGILNLHITSLGCYAMINLLYSVTEVEPLLYTKELLAVDGSTYQVSVPMPVGSTYHCEVKTTNGDYLLVHYITATMLSRKHSIFIYSHIYLSPHESELLNKDFASSSSQSCNRKTNSPQLFVLSSLARKRDLYSQVCFAKAGDRKHQNYMTSGCNKAASLNENGKSSLHTNTRKLKVMTYNIWNFNPYTYDRLYNARMDRLIQTVSKTSPDIIGLQEVRLEVSKGGSLGPNQMDHLVPLLKNYQYIFQPAQMFDTSLNAGRAEEGVAILSKYPILYHDYLLLFRNKRNSADSHQRVCLHAVISVPDVGMVHVFNTHYSLSHEAREEASKQILQFMSQHDGQPFCLEI